MILPEHTIINGDSRQMNLVADQSVHLVVTSPPYWQLKDYGTAEQIGFHESYESYINHLNLVWKECHRVLHPGCRLCVNIGDQFARAVYYGRYKVIPIRTEIIKFCETIGFDYMGAIIWQKVTTTNTTGGGAVMGSFPYPRNGILKLDYEFILLFKKQGKAPKPTPEQKKQSAMTTEEWNSFFSGHWHFAGARQEGHTAMFPEELPARLIRMFTFQGETVLDPFLGSGTSSLAAKNLGRRSVGYEINPAFVALANKKLGDTPSVSFLHDSPTCDFEAAIAQLPYVFRDPHRFDKKLDPRQNPFGSKIEGNVKKEREEYFSVKSVISPALVTLSNGETVQLLGIRPNEAKAAEAVRFLIAKTKGQKVFVRTEGEILADQPRPCYLYLKNRTFVNAHLVKSGLVDVALDAEFAQKAKFIQLSTDNQAVKD